jgi:leader peptidase (prepilin peptidase)/N-methyltransferase
MTLIFILSTLFLFALGAAVGSFINVVIYRTIEGGDWVRGRSRCDHCQKQIAWYDLIPLLSYFVLGGKSRCCHKPLSISHPVIETLTGSLFVWWYWFGFLFFHLTEVYRIIQPLFWLTVGILLLIIFLIDWWYMLIPDWAVVSLAVLSLIYRVALTWQKVMQFPDFVAAVAVTGLVSLFFWSMWYFTRGRGMGYGDVKLVIPLGLLLGFPKTLVGMFLAFVFGAVYGVILILTQKKSFKQAVPFGPFLIIGSLVALIWGEQIIRWYLNLL